MMVMLLPTLDSGFWFGISGRMMGWSVERERERERE